MGSGSTLGPLNILPRINANIGQPQMTVGPNTVPQFAAGEVKFIEAVTQLSKTISADFAELGRTLEGRTLPGDMFFDSRKNVLELGILNFKSLMYFPIIL